MKITIQYEFSLTNYFVKFFLLQFQCICCDESWSAETNLRAKFHQFLPPQGSRHTFS